MGISRSYYIVLHHIILDHITSLLSRPISLLALSLLRLLESNFTGVVALDIRIPPLRIKIMFESNPLKSIMLVRGLAAMCLQLRQTFAGSLRWSTVLCLRTGAPPETHSGGDRGREGCGVHCLLALSACCLYLSICACHPCAGAMLILSVPFQF